MIQEYYRQMRKFGCNILAVVQQYDVIKDSPVRGAMIGNSKMFLITSQQSREDAREIGSALGLSEKTVEHQYQSAQERRYNVRGSLSILCAFTLTSKSTNPW
jgi:hypothetical protein